ncbi:MAG: hypothetical protein ABIC40_03595, partial [bacterium]
MKAKSVLMAIILLLLACFITVGCGGGGGGSKGLTVGPIKGDATINENSSKQYNVVASGDTGIKYSWAIDAASLGSITSQNTAKCTFNAGSVNADTDGKIRVSVLSDHASSPVIRELKIIVKNTDNCPDPPTGVFASKGAFCDKVKIIWDPVNGATGYNIYRNGILLAEDPDGKSPYYDTTGTAFTTYKYRVSAFNQSCEGDWSDPYAEGYRNGPPTAPPTGVLASDGAYPDKVRVTWNAVGSATKYKIYRNGEEL